MSGNPLVSVIIPARNAQATLRETLDCLLAQSVSDWQALMIDDCSVDGTPEIIASYVARDPRFLAFKGMGQGASAARNIGLREARGRRILFLDSDDWVDPRFLEIMLAALGSDASAVASYCGDRRVMPDGGLAPVRSDPRIAHSPFEAFARSCAAAIHAVLVDRETLVSVGGFDCQLKTCEDWDLWQRVARLGGRWIHVDEGLSYYRASVGSLTQDIAQMMADAQVVIGRGFSTDMRVPSPAPDHRGGARTDEGNTREAALAYFALWCAACDCARGGSGSFVFDHFTTLSPAAEAAQALTETIFDGAVVGMRVIPEQMAARWAEFGPAIGTLIESLGRRWGDPVAARRLRYRFERMVLDYDDLKEERCLGLTLGLRIDVREPAPVAPRGDLDRLYAYLCDGDEVLAILDMGMLGTVTARQWIDLFTRHFGIQAAGGRAAQAGRLLRAAAQRSGLLRKSSVGEMLPIASHEHGLRRIELEAEAAARAAGPLPPPVSADGGAVVRRSDALANERREYMPVLMYRRIATDGPPELACYRVAPDMFRAQMSWLRRNGYHAIGSERLGWCLEHRHPFVGRPVMISFEDACQDFADAAWPILQHHDLTAEMFVAVDLVGKTARWVTGAGDAAPLMDAETIARLASEGLLVGSHLATHRPVDGLSTRELAQELLRSRAMIERWLGSRPRSFAPPFGLTEQRLRLLAAECGFSLGFSTEHGVATLESDPLNIPRIEVRGDWTLDDFVKCMESCL